MQRKFLTNLGLLLFLNFLIKPFWIFGIDLEVQNRVGAEEYGFYFAILNCSFLFNILLDFGITKFNNKNIAQNMLILNKHFSSIVILKLMLAAIYFIATFCFGLIVGYDESQIILLAMVGFNQFLSSFIMYLRSNISGLLLFKTDSFISILDRFLMIIICGVLLYTNIANGPFKIEWFVYSQTAAYVIAAFISWIIVIKKAKFKRLNWNWPFFILIIKQAFPFAILFLLMTFYNRIDAVMLERLIDGDNGDAQSGIYATGYRLLDAVNQVPFLFSILLFPIFAKMLKSKDSVDQMVKLSFTMLIIIAVIVATGSYFYNYEIINMLYKDRIEESANVFRLLILCFIPISTIYVFGSLLTANGNLLVLNVVAGSGMILNIIMNFILIPKFAAEGSAIASISTQSLSALLQIFFVQRIFKFNVNYRFLLKLFIFVIGVILINVLSKQLDYDWRINFILMCVMSAALVFGLRLLNVKSLINIIKSDHR